MVNTKNILVGASALSLALTLGVGTVSAQNAQRAPRVQNGTPTAEFAGKGRGGFFGHTAGIISNLADQQFTITRKQGDQDKTVTVHYTSSTTITKQPGGETTTLANGETVQVIPQASQTAPDPQATDITADKIMVIDTTAIKQNGVAGTIESATDTSLIIKTAEGTSVTATLNADTNVRVALEQKGTLSLQSLTLVGNQAHINGDKQSDGSYIAKQVVIGKEGGPRGGKEGFGKKASGRPEASTTPQAN